MKIILLISVILAGCSFTDAQSQIGLDKVREIKLLESNRDDVRKIFAGYKTDSTDTADDDYHYETFYTDDAEIRVDYSEGKCEDDESDGFNVPEWKAESVAINLNNPVAAAEIGIDLSKYRKEKMYYDLDDIYAYYDKNLGIIFKVDENKVESISFVPPPKYYDLMCDRGKAKILASSKSIFDRKLKERNGIISCPAANVEKLNLSRMEVTAGCDSAAAQENRSCSKSQKVINVSTIAIDPENDALTYSYTVSGGRIIGTGAKVVWDLTGLKAGTYQITAAVDDGCGYCGTPQTKTVVVKECSKCR